MIYNCESEIITVRIDPTTPNENVNPKLRDSNAHTTSADYQPTGLFSLPLDLRQMIYDLCIPATNGSLNITDGHEQTVLALQVSHPLIASEVSKRDQRQFSTLRIIISPRSALMPALLVPSPAFARIEDVEFVFSRIDLCKGVDCAHIRNARIHQQIASMITTTRMYVEWIAKTYADYALDYLSVSFDGHDDRVDSCWVELRGSSSSDENLLASTNQQPIYEALLAPLLKLPIVADTPYISPVHHVSNTHATLWNQNFMIDFHWTVMGWRSDRFNKTLNFYVQFLRQWEWTRPGVQYMLPESWYHDIMGMNREDVLRLVDVDVYGTS